VRIILAPEEVKEALVMYAESKGLTLSSAQMADIGDDGSVELSVDSIIPVNTDSGPVATAAVETETPAPTQFKQELDVAPERKSNPIADAIKAEVTGEPTKAVAVTADSSIWDKSHWISLRSTGFRKFVIEHLATLGQQDEKLQIAVKSKWATLYKEEPFPTMLTTEAPVETPVEEPVKEEEPVAENTDKDLFNEEKNIDAGSQTVQDLINENAGGDVTDKPAGDLEKSEQAKKDESLFG
jgi:hypothetical protein